VNRTDNTSLGGTINLPEKMRGEIADFLRKSARPSANGAALAEALGESLALKEVLSAPVRS
jgi:hypothetical protein